MSFTAGSQTFKEEWVLQYALVTKSNSEELQVSWVSVNTFSASSCGKATASSKNEGENKAKVGLKTIDLPAYFDNKEQFWYIA